MWKLTSLRPPPPKHRIRLACADAPPEPGRHQLLAYFVVIIYGYRTRYVAPPQMGLVTICLGASCA
eukprot:6213968-Prymnesium_polylepis.1